MYNVFATALLPIVQVIEVDSEVVGYLFDITMHVHVYMCVCHGIYGGSNESGFSAAVSHLILCTNDVTLEFVLHHFTWCHAALLSGTGRFSWP